MWYGLVEVVLFAEPACVALVFAIDCCEVWMWNQFSSKAGLKTWGWLSTPVTDLSLWNFESSKIAECLFR